MIIKIDRRKIESLCIFLSLVLVIILTVLGIFALADNFLSWDILPAKVEKIAYLLMWAFGIIIFASFLICLMVNLSIFTISMEKIAEKFDSTGKKE
ncbi:MAG TPA: hypothetical protein VJY62_08990 [Bacteroidia bacterium]|nr:hypothetical protein [Bacteroidia bacterium]